ncbi:MAG: arsenite methyltransferase [Planctomycetes bacterium]|nr:arsenite methyltransferase [Planctomycetota bacterium]
MNDPDTIRDAVRDGYARVARANTCCDCDCRPPSTSAGEASKSIGYTDEDLGAVPDGANLGVGCGNPTALAEIEPGQTVLDLGSGAGIDCFLAARAVGSEGRVIGVDMTDEMLESARRYATEGGFENVDFRKGIIEDMPVDDASVDVIISNCVINLSPEKDRVFAEAFRVLRTGGRLLVSDIVLDGELPPEVVSDPSAYVGCIAGAVSRDEYLRAVRQAGFTEIEIVGESGFGDTPAATSLKLRAVKT